MLIHDVIIVNNLIIIEIWQLACDLFNIFSELYIHIETLL
jgi:hypothetical protein